jgi:hypothetical protein
VTEENVPAAAGSRAVARCEACAQLLPEPDRRRPGGKQLYCPDGHGGYEASTGVTCREAGPHLKYVREHFSPTVLVAADLAVLGEHVTAVQTALAPEGPFGTLTRVLGALDERLGGTVSEALARAEQAEQAAREATGQAEADAKLRRIAERQSTAAVGAQHAAERDRDTATDRQQRAETAQRTAENAQARAEGERDSLARRAERAYDEAEKAREQLRQFESHNVALTTQVESLTEQLRLAASHAERDRAIAEQLQDQARRQFSSALADASTQLIELGDRHASTLRQQERDHAHTLRERDQDLLAARTAAAAATVTINRLLRSIARQDKRL